MLLFSIGWGLEMVTHLEGNKPFYELCGTIKINIVFRIMLLVVPRQLRFRAAELVSQFVLQNLGRRLCDRYHLHAARNYFHERGSLEGTSALITMSCGHPSDLRSERSVYLFSRQPRESVFDLVVSSHFVWRSNSVRISK